MKRKPDFQLIIPRTWLSVGVTGTAYKGPGGVRRQLDYLALFHQS